jgi:flagellar hook-associated protein 2
MVTSATSGSGLDVNSIVTQLMAVERQPLKKLDAKEASYQAKLSAYGTVKGALSSFQSGVQGLSSASSFSSLKATSSDTTAFSASTVSTAVAGTYALNVTSLAKAQNLVAVGQPSSTTAIGGAGPTTVTFDFGTIALGAGGSFTAYDPVAGTGGTYSGAFRTFTSNGNGTKSITIDSSNNSLQGIRDAINAAKVGVTAAIVNDGSGTPYRLTLSSNSSGVSNSLKISVSGDASVSTLLAHDPAGTQKLAETVTAQNAVFTVNGVGMSKTSNTISDVISGVTLTLLKEATPATLTVARDTSTTSTSIGGFVKAYNEFAKALKDVSAYDAAKKTGAILQGDSTVRSLQSQLRGILGKQVVGTPGVLTTLADVGISFQADGTLALNQAKLDSVLASNFSDVASLFASVGKATDSLVSFTSATSSTKAGSYPVNITQIATQGKAVGTAMAATTIIAATVNDALTLSVDGVAASIVLSPGSYTAQTMAAELQSKINGASTLSSAGISVAVTESPAGALTITSGKYGSASSVKSISGTAVADLLDYTATHTTTDGGDVAGTIGISAATGSGQALTADGGDPKGLNIFVSGGAIGARGAVNYSRGYASTLVSWITSNLASNGTLASSTDGIGKSIADLGKQRTALENRLVDIEKRYRAQFVALDASLSSMNQTQLYLTQQLSQVSK